MNLIEINLFLFAVFDFHEIGLVLCEHLIATCQHSAVLWHCMLWGSKHD